MHECNNPISIFRADDTDAFGLRTITIRLTGDLDLTNATAKFGLVGFTKTWTNVETATGELTLAFTANDTKTMPLGPCFGKLWLYDIQGATEGSDGKRLTVCNTIPFVVTNHVDGVQAEEYSINVSLSVDTEINITFEIAGGGSGESLWQTQPNGKVLAPVSNTIERILVPALSNVQPLETPYSLPDIKNVVNAILAALKG